MTGLGALIRRNCKLFFKDKGMFFTSLITPVILLVLYATFLAKVYRDSFAAAMPAGFAVDAALIDGTVGGQLVSSLLAVCCVTVAFCSNLLMVQDRISGARRDLTMTPVRPSPRRWLRPSPPAHPTQLSSRSFTICRTCSVRSPSGPSAAIWLVTM